MKSGLQDSPDSRNLPPSGDVSTFEDKPMRTYLPNLSATAWILLALPALMVARCVMMTVVSQVVQTVVPEVVRSVLRII
jgi:hypothetical protein